MYLFGCIHLTTWVEKNNKVQTVYLGIHRVEPINIMRRPEHITSEPQPTSAYCLYGMFNIIITNKKLDTTFLCGHPGSEAKKRPITKGRGGQTGPEKIYALCKGKSINHADSRARPKPVSVHSSLRSSQLNEPSIKVDSWNVAPAKL